MGRTHLFISNFEARDTQRLLLKILLFIPVLLFVMAINIFIDPTGLYCKTADKHESREYKIAQTLAEGKNVEVLRGKADDRLLQKYLVESMNAAPDIIVLGSSHSLWLGDNIFSGKKVINNSVLDAVLADHLGIFEGYAERNLYPSRVILILDPQLTVFPATSDRWASIKEDTYGMMRRLGIHTNKIKAPAVPKAWFNIFSFSYFQRSMDMFSHEDGKGDYLMFKDGRRLMGSFSKAPEKSRRKLIEELQHGPYALQSTPRRPDMELGGILEEFIRYLTGRHIQVTLCMLPVHPQLYKSLLGTPQMPGAVDILGFERYYRGLARKLNVRIAGSYDPAACGLDGSDFYDADHIRNDVMEKMLKQKGTICSMIPASS